ncbi:hypothetical protein N9948_00075 [bacterium]|nr:hypothetical protein [bacterium]
MKQKKKILSKYKRKMIIGVDEWTYRITHKTIDVCSPNQRDKWKIFISTWDEEDLSCDCFEDYGTSMCDCFWWYEGPYARPVKPNFVKRVIEDKIILKKLSFINLGTKESPIRVP